MSAYFEIAYAAASGKLCFFTGTGFSKAVSGSAAPGWQELLTNTCQLIAGGSKLAEELFPEDSQNPLPLEEAAQIIEIEFAREGKSLHDSIAEIIKGITLSGDNSSIINFIKDETFDVVTTNYDKLFESLFDEDLVHSLAPGLPIPKSHVPVRVYHVHGSVDSPRNMVVSSNDYYNFINNTSYFSQKLSTILHENTVVILGYALGDTNLKSILSTYKQFSSTNYVGSSIFFISRAEVSQHIKDYYAHSFGIRVIDGVSIHEFFDLIIAQMAAARACTDSSKQNIRKVLYEGGSYKNQYLKSRMSFFEILSSISAIGIKLNSPEVVNLIESLITKKIGFTAESGAWEQYEHLAEWLSYLCSTLELRGSSMETSVLAAIEKSMSTMSATYLLGSSWYAYKVWSREWSNVIPSNRVLIKAHIIAVTAKQDAVAIVSSI